MNHFIFILIIVAPTLLYGQKIDTIKIKKERSEKKNIVTNIDKPGVKSQQKLAVYEELDSSIVSFDAVVFIKGAYVTYNVKGNKLPANIVKSGTKIYIENIKALAPNGSIRRIRGFTLKEKK